MSRFVVLSGEEGRAEIAAAAVRAGERGLLDLGHAFDEEQATTAIRVLSDADARGAWGVRWDALGGPADLDVALGSLPFRPWPILLIAGVEGKDEELRNLVAQARRHAASIWLEVVSLAAARQAESAGCDGLIVKGNEAAGRVGEESTFLLLQQLRGQVSIPYFVQGGIGPDTAAAATLSGAAGAVLREQLWLAREASPTEEERRRWESLDGSETATVGSGRSIYRFFCRADRAALRDADRALAGGANLHELVRAAASRHPSPREATADQNGTTPGDAPLMPLGQEIAFARGLAERHGTVAGILNAYHGRIDSNLAAARRQKALAPGSALAAALGTRYPILQGPMTRVSDVAPFCDAVSNAGGLPFLALALMRGPEVRRLLDETQARLGNRPWGVGVLGFVPADLRKAQLDVIRQVRPAFAIIAGGRPSQARQLEQQGIRTFLHVPSPGLLESFVADGARRFIFEGRECGGHVGPRSSFTLWQSAIDTLLAADLPRPDELEVVFAGGIHDELSAAMVAALAAPLAQRGVRIGVLMGTAYLFTREAVECGAIVPEFQRQAIECRETVLLESGIGHATRCVGTPFADEFNAVRRELIQAGKAPDEIRMELEVLNVGRLRVASKGIDRAASDPGGRPGLVAVEEDEQRRRGIYMIGQVAALRDGVTTLAELHHSVSAGGLALLEDHASPRPADDGPPRRAGHDIAIVGIGGLFPGAQTVRRFWHNVVRGIDLVREVPPARWNVESFFTPDRTVPDQFYSKWGSFLDAVLFDPLEWLIPPAAVAAIEPAQLLSLCVARDALREAGLERGLVPRERTGVFFAASGCHDVVLDLGFRTLLRHYLPKVRSLPEAQRVQVTAELDALLPQWTEDSFAGFLDNVVAGRIANRFDLKGPNYAVDAACAAAIAALHAGIEQLRSGTTDAAVVGTVDVTNGPFTYMSFAKTHALSPTGRSRPFDDSADGIALGEAVGCVVLKRLEDAERDGNHIYAVIRGIGASSDGRARSLTAPHPPGQVLALRRAYEDAGIDPATISLIEAHGTGTAVGDSSEITSLSTLFDGRSDRRQHIAIGSVKSMIGHTKAAAGLVSLIKTALALEQQVLPPTLGVTTPSRLIDFSKSPFYVNSEARPWFASPDGAPRRAGVSAFGFGGTNFHVVLEEYVPHSGDEPTDATPRAAELLAWNDATRDGILERIERLASELTAADLEAFDDLASLAAAIAQENAARPVPGACRLSIAATSVSELRALLIRAAKTVRAGESLDDPAGVYYSEAPPIDRAAVAFLYPGQGSQSVDMLRDLVVSCRWSRPLFDRADRLLAGDRTERLSRLIYPPPSFTPDDRAARRAALNDTRAAQPALGAVELFATDLLARFGVRPAAVAGHSYGEFSALCAAGVLSPDDLLRVSAERGRIVGEANATAIGAMAAIRADEDHTRAILAEIRSAALPANLNAPDQTVIAGPIQAIEQALEEFPKRGVPAVRIPVTAAFHTPSMQPAADAFRRFLNQVPLAAPSIPVTANTTASAHPTAPDALRDLLARHLVEPVQFVRQVRGMLDKGRRVFVEVGPGRVLSDLVGRILGGEATALPMDVPGVPGWLQLARLLGRLVALGYPVQVGAWFAGRGLTERSSTEVLAAFRARTQPKPTDWILTASRAIPATATAAPHRAVVANSTAGASPPGNVPAAPPTPSAVVETTIRDLSSTRHEQGGGAAAPEAPRSAAPPVVPPVPVSSKPHARRSESRPALPRRLPLPATRRAAGRPMAVSPKVTPMIESEADDSLSLISVSVSHGEPTPTQSEMAAGLQHVFAQWMDLQAAQAQVTERFLHLQERLLLGAVPTATPQSTPRALPAPSTNGNGHTHAPPRLAPGPESNGGTSTATTTPRDAHSEPAATAPAARRVARPPVAVRALPETASPKSIPSERAAVPRSSTSGEARVSPRRPAPQPVALATPAASGAATPQPTPAAVSPAPGPLDDALTVEGFERDLLQAVSDRTGYPTVVLNLDMALESGLGIDSIKTIEIFNKLKKYHDLFRTDGADEDEVLAEFARLHTLRDIVSMFATRRAAKLNGNGHAGNAASNGAVHASSHLITGRGPAVERFALETADAPHLPVGGEKKNGSPVISSS